MTTRLPRLGDQEKDTGTVESRTAEGDRFFENPDRLPVLLPYVENLSQEEPPLPFPGFPLDPFPGEPFGGFPFPALNQVTDQPRMDLAVSGIGVERFSESAGRFFHSTSLDAGAGEKKEGGGTGMFVGGFRVADRRGKISRRERDIPEFKMDRGVVGRNAEGAPGRSGGFLEVPRQPQRPGQSQPVFRPVGFEGVDIIPRPDRVFETAIPEVAIRPLPFRFEVGRPEPNGRNFRAGQDREYAGAPNPLLERDGMFIHLYDYPLQHPAVLHVNDVRMKERRRCEQRQDDPDPFHERE